MGRKVVALKLLLCEFDIRFNTKSPLMPNVDLASSILSLCQIIYPLGYEFGLINNGSRHIIRSERLTQEIKELFEKDRDGRLSLAEKQYKMKPDIQRKVSLVKLHTRVPDSANEISQYAWWFICGLYNEITMIETIKNGDIADIFIHGYEDFLPYLDLIEESLINLRMAAIENGYV